MTTGIKAMIRRNVTRSSNAASCTTKTSHSQSPRAAGLSSVHFFQSAFHMISACHRSRAILPDVDPRRPGDLLFQHLADVERLVGRPAVERGLPDRDLAAAQGPDFDAKSLHAPS